MRRNGWVNTWCGKCFTTSSETNQGDLKVKKINWIWLIHWTCLMYVYLISLSSAENTHSCHAGEIFTKINQDISFRLLMERQDHKTIRLQGEPLKMNFLKCLLHPMWASRHVYTYMFLFILMNNENTIFILLPSTTKGGTIIYQRHTICRSQCKKEITRAIFLSTFHACSGVRSTGRVLWEKMPGNNKFSRHPYFPQTFLK